MPVIGSNSEILKEYLGPQDVGNVYLGSTKVQNGVTPLILDDYPAVAAYSTRKLRNNYTGPALQVLNDSTSATKDIYFINGQLDTGSILDFIGSASGSVNIWYDQSGNGIDIQPVKSIYKPKIAYSGSMYNLSGSNTPFAVNFLGEGVAPDGYSLSSSLNAISSSVGTLTDATVFAVENVYLLTHKEDTSWCDPTPAGGGYSGGNYRSTNLPYLWTYADSTGAVNVQIPDMTENTKYLLAYNYNRTGDTVKIQANTGSADGLFGTGNSPSWDTLMIGGYPAGDFYTKMYMSEFILLSGSLDQTDVDIIRTNINQYYNCY